MAVQYAIHGRTATAIAASIEDALRGGRLGAGDQMPTVRALATRLRVSPATVMGAYHALRRRGILVAHGRGGTSVSARPPLITRAAVPIPAHARNLADGYPDPAFLPSLDAALATLDTRPRLYSDRGADPALLALASRQFAAEGIPTRSLCVVGGALDGIERALQAHLRSGDRIAVEDPGFTGVLDLAGALGLAVEPMRVDDYGPLPDEMSRALRRGARACVVTPRAQNPTGGALDADRAAELRRVLADYPEALVIEDDHAGPVAGSPAVTLCDADRPRWAVVRSVSKSLGPDLRLGVMSGDATTIARIEGRRLIGAGWVSHILQGLVVRLWSDAGVARLLRRAESAYASRRAAMLRALAAHGIAGSGRTGMNVWIPVAEEGTTVRLLLDAGWAVTGGERFRVQCPPAIRVTVATLAAGEAEAFAAALAAILTPAHQTRSA